MRELQSGFGGPYVVGKLTLRNGARVIEKTWPADDRHFVVNPSSTIRAQRRTDAARERRAMSWWSFMALLFGSPRRTAIKPNRSPKPDAKPMMWWRWMRSTG